MIPRAGVPRACTHCSPRVAAGSAFSPGALLTTPNSSSPTAMASVAASAATDHPASPISRHSSRRQSTVDNEDPELVALAIRSRQRVACISCEGMCGCRQCLASLGLLSRPLNVVLRPGSVAHAVALQRAVLALTCCISVCLQCLTRCAYGAYRALLDGEETSLGLRLMCGRCGSRCVPRSSLLSAQSTRKIAIGKILLESKMPPHANLNS